MRPWRDWPDWITFPIIALLCLVVPLAAGLAVAMLRLGGGWAVGVAALIGFLAYLKGLQVGRRSRRAPSSFPRHEQENAHALDQ
jgi:hypothetical protein